MNGQGSQKRIEANRANSRRSTGPRTPEGKAASSRNAVRHGLLSRVVVLKGEDRAEFETLRDGLFLDMAPVGQLEETLVDRMAGQWWRLQRVGRMEAVLMEHDLGGLGLGPDEDGEFLGAMPLPVLGEGHVGSPAAKSGHALPPQRRNGMAPDGNAARRRPDGRAVRARVYDDLADTLGRRFCPYDTLRRYERAIERGLDATMRQFRDAQKRRIQNLAPNFIEQEGRDPAFTKFSEYLITQRRGAVQELAAVRAAAEEAGVKLPASAVLAEEGIMNDSEDLTTGLRRHVRREAEEGDYVSALQQRLADAQGVDAGPHGPAAGPASRGVSGLV